MDTQQRMHNSTIAVNVGLIANVFLSALKTSVGILGHSPALLADGINSTSDVAYYLVVAVFMRLARKPADDEHPYGHSQLENIASLVVGAFVMTTGVAVFWGAINDIYDLIIGESKFGGAASMALWIALFTVALKIGLTWFTNRKAKATGNAALMALAYDHRNDVFSASSAAIGIYLGRAGYPWVDPLVGALVALLILRTGVEILRQSSAELMDAVPSRALAERITALIQPIPGVRQVEEIHAHRFGPYLVINLTIGVEGGISVKEGDEIASQVEHLIYTSLELVRRVYVHYHPVVNGELESQENALAKPALHCDLEG